MTERIFIACEGESEAKYLECISKNINANIIYKVYGGYKSTNILEKIIKNFRKDKPEVIYVWKDYDVNQRKDKNWDKIENLINKMNKTMKHCKIEMIYSYYNFEDFISMHSDKCTEWQKICQQNNHFYQPMYSDVYLQKFQQLFPGYQKSVLYFNEIDDGKINTLKQNQQNKNCHFKCGIIKLFFG